MKLALVGKPLRVFSGQTGASEKQHLIADLAHDPRLVVLKVLSLKLFGQIGIITYVLAKILYGFGCSSCYDFEIYVHPI